MGKRKKHLPVPHTYKKASYGQLSASLEMMRRKAALYFQLTKVLAAEFYAICPEHKVFTGTTFAEETKETIEDDSKLCILDLPWDKIVFYKGAKVDFSRNIKKLKAQIEKQALEEAEKGDENDARTPNS